MTRDSWVFVIEDTNFKVWFLTMSFSRYWRGLHHSFVTLPLSDCEISGCDVSVSTCKILATGTGFLDNASATQSLFPEQCRILRSNSWIAMAHQKKTFPTSNFRPFVKTLNSVKVSLFWIMPSWCVQLKLMDPLWSNPKYSYSRNEKWWLLKCRPWPLKVFLHWESLVGKTWLSREWWVPTSVIAASWASLPLEMQSSLPLVLRSPLSGVWSHGQLLPRGLSVALHMWDYCQSSLCGTPLLPQWISPCLPIHVPHHYVTHYAPTATGIATHSAGVHVSLLAAWLF